MADDQTSGAVGFKMHDKMHDEGIEPTGMRASGSADYMLRTAQQNIMQMSTLADQKASFVLGAGLVMATLVFGDIAGDSDLDAARLALLASALTSSILAAIVLAPRLRPAKGRPQPLFFGSIAQMSRDEYHAHMREVIADGDRIYTEILDDLHAASTVLVTSKFRPLQASYVVLVAGMIATFFLAVLT